MDGKSEKEGRSNVEALRQNSVGILFFNLRLFEKRAGHPP
jgi:hypothetical protein